jgi:hypothetical protein
MSEQNTHARPARRSACRRRHDHPARREYAAPGADDAAIQADILQDARRDTTMVRAALDHLARLAEPLADLAAVRRDEVATEFRATGGAAAAVLVRVVLQCYYRDDRVLRSLGLELRAPFPKATLEEGDWSLLDPVKARSSDAAASGVSNARL